LEYAEADAQASDADGSGEVADFEDFLIEEVGDARAAGGDENSAGVGVEGGDFLIVLRKKIEALEAGRAVEGAAALDGDGGVAAGDARGSFEGAAFKCFSRGAAGHIQILHGEETLRSVFVREVNQRLVVAEPEGIAGFEDEGIFAGGMKFAAGIIEEEESGGVLAGAGVGIHGGGEKLDGDDVSVGRPGEGFDLVGEEFVFASEFLAFEETLAFAAGFEEPDVVALEIVFFGFEHAADGEDDVAIGSVGEGGDFFVDVGYGLVEVLSADRKTERINAEYAESAEYAEKRTEGYGWLGRRIENGAAI
jgi:hypothetical protein